jgi:cellulose synthase/poly-beta-1,6-N-acetylglucosamine synthase-like glycosyltransferase
MNVSIVIPVYNEEDYVGACLDALAKQTVKPAEVIVVDNNSTDNTQRITRRYSFVQVVTEEQQGTVFARNAGFKVAKSEIMARIDADTRLPANWVAKVTKTFKDNPDVAAVTGGPQFYDVPLARLSNIAQVLVYQRIQKLLSGSYILWGANMAIRRQAWQQVSSLCVQRVDIDEDIDLSLWLHKNGLVIRYLSNVPVGASFQRGHTGLKYTVHYLASWPRDYLLHRMYLRALFLSLLILLGLLIFWPLLVVLSLKSHLAD